MFAYCLNNPVNNYDPNGNLAISITTLILIGSAIFGAGCAGYTAYVEYQAGCDTVQIVGDSICAGFAGFNIVYTFGMSAYQLYQYNCYLKGLTPVTNIGGNSEQINLYRAMSPEEYASAVSSQKFSSGANSYEDSKFFATTQADAQKWGNAMYKNSSYEVISATFNSSVISSTGTQYYPSLDGIGPAYSIPIHALNKFVIAIK